MITIPPSRIRRRRHNNNNRHNNDETPFRSWQLIIITYVLLTIFSKDTTFNIINQCHAFHQFTNVYNSKYIINNECTMKGCLISPRKSVHMLYSTSQSSTSSSTCEEDISNILGEPVELQYTEYDSESDYDHDPVILLHGMFECCVKD